MDLPLVYHPDYSFPFPAPHRFPMDKFVRLHDHLRTSGLLHDGNLHSPERCSRELLALAHDPRIDDAGLMAGLESDAFYLGAMGSVRTSARRLERLQRIAEASQTQLARIHAPIGLPIGSKTPIEIAIAVLAEVIAVRQGIRLRDATDAA